MVEEDADTWTLYVADQVSPVSVQELALFDRELVVIKRIIEQKEAEHDEWLRKGAKKFAEQYGETLKKLAQE